MALIVYSFATGGDVPLVGAAKAARRGPQPRLTDELKRYEYEIHPGGRISYDAPSGFHDDCVVALALANATRLTGTPPAPMCPIAVARRVGIFRPCQRVIQ